MIRFVFGGAGYGKSEFVLRDIKEELKRSEKSIYLIVPEQQTVVYETKLASYFSPESALRLEATNFTRLSDSVARQAGGLTYNNLTHGALSLITWRAVISVWDSLSTLNSVPSGGFDKLIPLIESALEELKANSVTEKIIDKVFSDTSDTEDPLCGRMRDLSLIYSAYKSIMTEEYGSDYDTLSRLDRQVKECDFFNGTSVYIDSFYSVTKEEHKIIEQIMKTADDVTITVSMAERNADGIHLEAVRRFYKTLLAEAVRCGEVRFVNLDKNYRAVCGELEIIEKYLFDYTVGYQEVSRLMAESDKPSAPDSVRVLSVSDRYEEAEAAACEIEKFVRRGARYSDIAVIARDITSLHGITDACFRRHSIPCFTAQSEKIESSPLTRYLMSLLNVIGAWRREDVIRLVKTGLSPLDELELNIFERYTDTWNIRGRRMFASEWSMNPDGYKQELSDWGRKALLIANNARENLIPPIEKFSEIYINGAARAEDICRAIVEYAADAGLYESILKYAGRLEEFGCIDAAARERLVWGKFCECFDTIAHLMPDVKTDSRGFASLLRLALADADAGAIPTRADEVALGSANGLRTGEVKHVILLGCVDGEFPGVAEDGRFFSDSDKLKLEEMGIDLWGRTSEKSSMELFRFWRSACIASETLTVLVPQSSFGAECAISQGASRILELTGKERPVRFSSLPLSERLFHPASLESAIGAASSSGCEYMRDALIKFRNGLSGKETSYNQDSGSAAVSQKTAGELFGDRVCLTQSRLESFVQCPFSYYLKYNLRLSEDKKAQISAPDIGIFIHAVLEEFFAVTKDSDYPLDRAETEKICGGLIEEYILKTCGALPDDSRLKYLFMRLKRGALVFIESIMREFSQSKFKMYRAEMKFGYKDDMSPEPLEFRLDDGTIVSLYGIVDRMDVFCEGGKSYIRVIDYKTGSKKFSLDDVKVGLNIQLLLYLFSAWKSKNSRFVEDIAPNSEILPAGALYFSAKPGDLISDIPLSEEEAREKMISSIERCGIVLDDRELLEAMDQGISGRYIPVTLKADGTLKQSSSLATLEKFGELYRDMEESICRIGKMMKSGDAAARPLDYHGSVPCGYCSMKSICRKSV